MGAPCGRPPGGGIAVKRIMWAAPVIAVCLALLAGKDDIVRFRAMQRMSHDR